tara:strand:+ start:4120 stop:4536 length:417 start_codon:yes stop_codon:yes gene_type:complete
MDIPHHIRYKKSIRISKWKKVYGLICREGQTYEDIYEKVQTTTHCEKCQVELCDGTKSNGRCMDHDHNTRYFRMVLCRKCNAGHKREIQCNNTTGIVGIHKFDNGWRYQPKVRGVYTKYSTNKQIVLWAKFIYELSLR